ncbi:MAG: hypothetical protein GY804_08800 [Alphaproteobacteria bacterium]|nr:hypothetical protein [Alphaproteobacteria bacterium]
MINSKEYTMDVYYKPQSSDVAMLTVRRSWDGALYGETNIRSLCGPDHKVIGEDISKGVQNRVASINSVLLNTPTTIPCWW